MKLIIIVRKNHDADDDDMNESQGKRTTKAELFMQFIIISNQFKFYWSKVSIKQWKANETMWFGIFGCQRRSSFAATVVVVVAVLFYDAAAAVALVWYITFYER